MHAQVQHTFLIIIKKSNQPNDEGNLSIKLDNPKLIASGPAANANDATSGQMTISLRRQIHKHN